MQVRGRVVEHVREHDKIELPGTFAGDLLNGSLLEGDLAGGAAIETAQARRDVDRHNLGLGIRGRERSVTAPSPQPISRMRRASGWAS